MKGKHKLFQIRTKRDARFLASRIKKSEKVFYYFVPLVGGMEGSFNTITCNNRSNICSINSLIPGLDDAEIKSGIEIANHIWEKRKYINAEIRDPDSEWHLLVSGSG